MTKRATILAFCGHSLGYLNYAPTIADIASATGLNLATVRHWVKLLAAAGEIETDRRGGRWVIVVRRVRG